MTKEEKSARIAREIQKLVAEAHRLADEIEKTQEKRMTKWLGKAPTKCDFCHDPITDAFVDARLKTGSWGCVCPRCHSNYGVGIGTGRGQIYERKDGEFIKTGG